METWQINLTLIPSIAVILTSSNRMALGLTDEINQWFWPEKNNISDILFLKIKQLKRLSLAIFLMYVSLSLPIINAILVGFNILPVKYDKFGIIIF